MGNRRQEGSGSITVPGAFATALNEAIGQVAKVGDYPVSLGSVSRVWRHLSAVANAPGTVPSGSVT